MAAPGRAPRSRCGTRSHRRTGRYEQPSPRARRPSRTSGPRAPDPDRPGVLRGPARGPERPEPRDAVAGLRLGEHAVERLRFLVRPSGSGRTARRPRDRGAGPARQASRAGARNPPPRSLRPTRPGTRCRRGSRSAGPPRRHDVVCPGVPDHGGRRRGRSSRGIVERVVAGAEAPELATELGRHRRIVWLAHAHEGLPAPHVGLRVGPLRGVVAAFADRKSPPGTTPWRSPAARRRD